MKNSIPLIALILGVVFVIIAVVLPSGSDKAEFIKLAKMLPAEVGEFTYIDMRVLQSDEGLQSTWESIKDYFLGEDIYGEDIGDVTGFGMAGSELDIMLYSGDFNISRMVSAIEETSVESLQYEGITIWTDMYSYSTAIIDGMVFIGSRDNLQLCIDVVAGESASLYGDKDAQDVIGRMPGGYMLGCMVVDEGDSSVGAYGVLAIGMAAWQEGGNISQMSLFKFEDSDALQEYFDLIEPSITGEYDVTKDGRYLTIASTSELPSPEEEAYNSIYDELDYAVYAYYASNAGALPTINGTVNVSGSDYHILDICALLTSAGGILSEVPEGVAVIDGPDNDNCDAGCANCSAGSHYVWAVDDYGIYSVCVGEDCDANGEDGFQGVWP